MRNSLNMLEAGKKYTEHGMRVMRAYLQRLKPPTQGWQRGWAKWPSKSGIRLVKSQKSYEKVDREPNSERSQSGTGGSPYRRVKTSQVPSKQFNTTEVEGSEGESGAVRKAV